VCQTRNGICINFLEAAVVVLWRFVVTVLWCGARFGVTVWGIEDAGGMYALRECGG
jgi:hypothetical protein